ncbi:MAG: hypothetical protein JW795_04095 [Chitinivibrionales bacterium]|nr:hypothetical protein [Chitinivibrionales bacterium]
MEQHDTAIHRETILNAIMKIQYFSSNFSTVEQFVSNQAYVDAILLNVFIIYSQLKDHAQHHGLIPATVSETISSLFNTLMQPDIQTSTGPHLDYGKQLWHICKDLSWLNQIKTSL